MSNKTTKRALLSSVVALFLCCAMLMGTTYAWFTDEVTSANNVIKSGNLDVVLEYYKDGKWHDVQGASDIISNDLWEPGTTEVAYLRFKNNGTLGLKYQLGVNIVDEAAGVNVAGASFKLSDYIYYDVFNAADANGNFVPFADRAAALAGTTETTLISEGYNVAGTLAAGTATAPAAYSYIAMVVYMPTTVGNEANHDGAHIPQIDLGINIFATQMAAEEDSFGPDYDEDAWHTQMSVYTAADLQAALTNATAGTEIVLENDIVLTESIVIPAAPTTYSLRSNNAVKLDLNGKKITTAYDETTQKHQYAIDNYGNLVIEGGVIEARGIYNREGANLTVNGTKIVNLDTNGGSSIWSYGGKVILNDAELIGYTGCVYSNGYLEINGGTYTCYSAVLDDGTQVGPTYNIRSNGELVINGGDFTSRHGLIAVGGPSAVINGGTYTMTSIGVITSHVFYVSKPSAVVTVNGGTFNCDLRTAQANGSSMICVGASDVTVAVKGGTFNLTPAAYVADGFKAVAVDGKYYVVPEEVGTVIVTAADLLALGGKSLEGVVYIAADIDLNGAAMPTIGAAYGKSLTVIGAGHTISNATTAHTSHNGMKHHGFFYAYTNSTLTVSDLSFDGIVIDATKDAERNYGAAIVVAYADGGSNVVLNNVDVANCKVLNNTPDIGDEAGVYVGYQTGTLTMTDCDSVKCEVAGETAEKTGAFIGMVNGTATLTNCTTDLEIGYCNRIGGTLVVDGMTVVNSGADLKDALAAGEQVIYANGVVVEGSSQLNTGATIIGATFSNPDGVAVTQTISGTFKDCTFVGSEALRWCYAKAGDTVVFENCVFKTDFRGVHFDGMAGDVIFKNCEINGFNAIGGEGTVTFEGCTFGNDASSYNGLNMYSNINLIDCTFNYVSGKTNFIDMEGTGKTLTITNCTATLDGVEANIADFVGGSKLAENTVVYN